MKQVFILFFGLSLIGCSTTQFEKELNKIDSLTVSIDSIENIFNKIEFDSLKFMVDNVQQDERNLKRFYNPDTVNVEFANAINNYKSVRKAVKKSGQYKIEFKSEIIEIKKQLSDLKSDIKNGMLTETEIKKYLQNESKDCKKLISNFEAFNDVQKIASDIYYESQLIVRPFIDSLIRINT